jgi:hypothetical protein
MEVGSKRKDGTNLAQGYFHLQKTGFIKQAAIKKNALENKGVFSAQL